MRDLSFFLQLILKAFLTDMDSDINTNLNEGLDNCKGLTSCFKLIKT